MERFGGIGSVIGFVRFGGIGSVCGVGRFEGIGSVIGVVRFVDVGGIGSVNGLVPLFPVEIGATTGGFTSDFFCLFIAVFI